MIESSRRSTSSPAFGVSVLDFGHSNWCVVVSHCFNLHVFGDIMMWITSLLMTVFQWIDKRTLVQIKSLLFRLHVFVDDLDCLSCGGPHSVL